MVDFGFFRSSNLVKKLPQMPMWRVFSRGNSSIMRAGRKRYELRDLSSESDLKKKKKPKADLPVIGWREWVGLPDLGIAAIHAKIDTGATTSALHAEIDQIFYRQGVQLVQFTVRLGTRHAPEYHQTEAELLEYRRVKSSSGHYSRRPVVLTHAAVGGLVWPIEITLANRETMGMPMLLGRQSLKNRFLVNPARSHLLSHRSVSKKTAKKKST